MVHLHYMELAEVHLHYMERPVVHHSVAVCEPELVAGEMKAFVQEQAVVAVGTQLVGDMVCAQRASGCSNPVGCCSDTAVEEAPVFEEEDSLRSFEKAGDQIGHQQVNGVDVGCMHHRRMGFAGAAFD